MSNLCNIIREEVPKAVLVPLERRFWSETTGLQYIQSLAFAEDVEALKIAVQGSFYAICSFSAVRIASKPTRTGLVVRYADTLLGHLLY